MQRTVTAPTHYRHSAFIVHRKKWGKVFLNQRVAGVAGMRLIFFNLFLILVRGMALWITRRCPVVLTTSVGQLRAPWRSHPDHLSPIPVLGLDGVVWRCRNPPRTEQALVSVEAAHISRLLAVTVVPMAVAVPGLYRTCTCVLHSWPWRVPTTS